MISGHKKGCDECDQRSNEDESPQFKNKSTQIDDTTNTYHPDDQAKHAKRDRNQSAFHPLLDLDFIHGILLLNTIAHHAGQQEHRQC